MFGSHLWLFWRTCSVPVREVVEQVVRHAIDQMHSFRHMEDELNNYLAQVIIITARFFYVKFCGHLAANQTQNRI